VTADWNSELWLDDLGSRPERSMIRDQVQIENPKKLSLSTTAEAALRYLFSTHQRVIIKAELGSGFSGSWVFLVHPIRDTPELPAVVKIAPAGLIEQEYQAYQEHIRNKLSGAAEIRSEPVLLPGSHWACLCYHLVGSGIFQIESLNSFCRHANIKDIWYVLEKRLFKRIAPLWQFSHTIPQFDLRVSYDHLLPVNLILKPNTSLTDDPRHVLTPRTWTSQQLHVGDHVRLEGFVVTEVDKASRSVTLNLCAPSDGLPTSYRLRLQPVDALSSYRENDVVDSVDGVVVTTRDDLLKTYARGALGPDLAAYVAAQRLVLPGDQRIDLPNPLVALPEVMSEPHHVRVASIHGDLNMENILVDPDTRDVRLIDFAMTRQDHVLHDLLRLETGVVTWLLPEAMAKNGLPPETIQYMYEQLHHNAARPSGHFFVPQELYPALRTSFVMLATIRKMAQGYLFAPNDWREYYQGLTLYLLGALKFKNLDDVPEAPLPKQVAFWGAATIQWLLQEQPPYENAPWQPHLRDWPQQTTTVPVTPQPAHLDLPPFIAGPPILHPRQFFGRGRELGRLFNLWRRTPLQNAAIIGPRRSGKTSLLFYLRSITNTPKSQLRRGQRADWLSEPGRYRWVFVDFQDPRMGSQEDLLGHLLAGLDLGIRTPAVDSAARSRSASLAGSKRAPCSLDYFLDIVSDGLDTPTIILLDEIGVALQRYPELDATFWESLRSLATNYVRGNLAFVLAAHESPGQLAGRSNIGSPFFNIFGYTATLGPLTEEEARELVASSPISFSPADVDWILDRSECWPVLLQILCRERLVALEENEVSDTWQQDGLDQMASFRHLLAGSEPET
jgi:hypothetical protein